MRVEWANRFVEVTSEVLKGTAYDSLKYIGAFCGSLGIALLLTPIFRGWASRVGMVDMPSARRINKSPTPRGGGVAIFIAFHAMLWLMSWRGGGGLSPQFSLEWQWSFLLASSLLVVVGLIDDRYGMKPIIKLAGQVGVALLLYFSGVHLGGIIVAFPKWLDCVVSVLWIVGVVNAFNLIDGMDGLATGLALIAAIGIGGALLFTGNSAATLPYLILAGGCLGFLRYNFHPASVFLGDTGSMFLGLCLATMPLVSGSRKELLTSIGVPLLAMGVPLFDTLLAIWRRTVRALLPDVVAKAGSRMLVMQPDKDHVHHRILRDTLNQRTASAMLYGISLALVGVGLVGSLLKGRAPGLFLIAFIVAIFVVVRHLERVELWDTGRLLSSERKPIRQSLMMPLMITLDALVLCGVWIMTRWLLGLSLARVYYLENMPLYVVPSFIALVVAKTYWRVWARALMRDVGTLVVAVLTGAGMGLSLCVLLDVAYPYLVRFTLLYGALGVIPLVALRLWRDTLSGMMHALERRMLLERSGSKRVVAYGGGRRFRSYLREIGSNLGSNNRVIVGVIDDEINLKGRIVAGYRVLGSVLELGRIVSQQRADALIITCGLSESAKAHVVQMAGELGLELSEWACEEREICFKPKGGQVNR